MKLSTPVLGLGLLATAIALVACNRETRRSDDASAGQESVTPGQPATPATPATATAAATAAQGSTSNCLAPRVLVAATPGQYG